MNQLFSQLPVKFTRSLFQNINPPIDFILTTPRDLCIMFAPLVA